MTYSSGAGGFSLKSNLGGRLGSGILLLGQLINLGTDDHKCSLCHCLKFWSRDDFTELLGFQKEEGEKIDAPVLRKVQNQEQGRHALVNWPSAFACYIATNQIVDRSIPQYNFFSGLGLCFAYGRCSLSQLKVTR